VPKDDPKEPLATGSTPLEKARAKLKVFEQKISDPNQTPSDRELEQFGRLKMAVQEFENKKEGGKKGLFGGQDKSDLDESITRQVGKNIRKVVPNSEDRQTIVKARQIHLKYLRGENPLLRRRTKASTEEILSLEREYRDVSNTLSRLQTLIKGLPKKTDYSVRSKLENLHTTLDKAEKSYSNAIARLTKG
jgi:hypothetical protein